MIDLKDGASASVRISWEMLTERDNCPDAPDERQDGYWPSRNADDAGWVPPEKFDYYMVEAHDRMDAWNRDDWYYLGVQARAHILIPFKTSGSAHILTLTSAGVWGVESDSDPAYLRSLYLEEKESLLQEIQILTTAFMNGECVMEEDPNAQE